MRRPLAALALVLATGSAAPDAPALDANFPDPAVLRAPDGFYYAYATQGQAKGRTLNIQVARSRDLRRWHRLGDALPAKPGWARRTQDFWAPDVSQRDGRYYLYYSAKPDAALDDPSRGLCLGVATASRPQGPFADSGRPLLCGDGFVNIDPFAFDDPQTGKRLLFWGSGFGPIRVQELGPDRMSFAAGSSPVPLVDVVKTDDPNNYRRLVEGAWVIQRDGWYYLFYSGDNCCGPKAHYAVMVARSRSAMGPYESRPGGAVILAADGRWLAPGHNSVIRDDAGQDWILYHAVDRRRSRERSGDEINSRRVLLVRKLDWRDGWPVVRHPSGRRAAPASQRQPSGEGAPHPLI